MSKKDAENEEAGPGSAADSADPCSRQTLVNAARKRRQAGIKGASVEIYNGGNCQPPVITRVA